MAMFKNFFQQFKFKMMAKQIRQPSGPVGHKVGEMMNKANEFLYDFTSATMELTENQSILEIGFGNGKFFDTLFAKAKNMKITGLDFSETMFKEAQKNNSKNIADGNLTLQLGSSDKLPFKDNSFDKVFCINVVYFWDEPQKHLQEISRVLKPGGKFYATIRTKESMELMPFTKYGFTKYNEEEWKQLINKNPFTFIKAERIDEPAVDFDNKSFQVQSLCLVAEKK
jgi:ubiquinone/menaquinone biosynthesis C-methylase UbiE